MAAKQALTPATNKALKRKKWGSGEIQRHIAFMTMLLPGLVFMACFNYLPMPALILAFKNYKLYKPPKTFWIQNRFIYSCFIKSEWSGFENFKFIFGTSDAWMVIRNTVGYNLIFMSIGLVLAVTLAIMVDELRNRFAAKLYHTILFMPYFISWIIVAYVVYAFVSSKGLINVILKSMGKETVEIYQKVAVWPFIFIWANIWKYTGNNSIIYLATLSGFDQELYEAAAIDGATKWQQIRHITLPQLLPTIVLLQILAVGRIFNGDFDMFYTLPNGSGVLRNVYTTLDVYVYNAIKTGAQLGMPSAAALFQSVVGFVLVLTTNAIVNKVQPEMAMF